MSDEFETKNLVYDGVDMEQKMVMVSVQITNKGKYDEKTKFQFPERDAKGRPIILKQKHFQAVFGTKMDLESPPQKIIKEIVDLFEKLRKFYSK